MKKLISIVTACYNEEENVELLYSEVRKQMLALADRYDYEHLFIDNASEDKTVEILKGIAAQDRRVKIIVNARNFGHIRSPFHALLQAQGEAIISIVADLQDPPALIPQFIAEWEKGSKLVLAVKQQSEESTLFFFVRRMYYRLLRFLSEVPIIENYTGFGLYDRQVMDVLRGLEDPYPFFRGLICEIGFERKIIPYVQPKRYRGFTKNNFYTLYDIGILGLTSHSKKPLRLATMAGFLMGMFSLVLSFAYFILKIVFWDQFNLGLAPLILGLFFFSSVQLFFLGIIGEYIGNIYIKVMNRPLVVEKERVNFGEQKGLDS